MFNIKNAQIGTKFIVGFLLLAVIATAVNILNITRFVKIKNMQQQLYSQNIEPVKALVNVTDSYQKMRIAARDMVIAKTTDELERANTARKDNFTRAIAALNSIAASNPNSRTNVEALKSAINQHNSSQDTIYYSGN